MKNDGTGKEIEQKNVEKHVGYQLKLLDRLFCKRMLSCMKKDGYESMTMLAGWILEYVAFYEEHPIYQKDIEKKFQVGKSTITGVMKSLEKNHLIERKSVMGDARLKQICLTRDGEAYIAQVQKSREDMERCITQGISEKDMEHFFGILHKMQENLLEK